MKMYVAVLDEFPDYMTPTLVAHAVLGAHLEFSERHKDENGYKAGEPYYPLYVEWLETSFKKVVVRVNQTEFDRIAALPDVYLGHEKHTLEGRDSCAVVCPRLETPRVLKFSRLWKPNHES